MTREELKEKAAEEFCTVDGTDPCEVPCDLCLHRANIVIALVLEEAAKVAEDNEPEPSKEEMDDSYDAGAAYRVGRWEAAGDIATAIRALKEGK